MTTIWGKGEDDGSSGGFRSSALPLETSRFKVGRGTNSMRIIKEDECNSSSSSSIGDDSDGDREEDIESRYNYDDLNNNGSFDDAIQALEQALPIRRGISTFYNGKSKSFTSLTDVWTSTTSSIQDITKPENAYTRKRRNIGAVKLLNINNRRISKKPKTTKLQFTKHGTQSEINRSFPSRSFSMVNLHRCNSTKIGNC